MQDADKLLRELERLGLEPVDAHRTAFTALALARGWTPTRIGRFLGITRARIGQRQEKLRRYMQRDDTPCLTRVMLKSAEWDDKERRPGRADVEFTKEDWHDLSFARQLIDIVA